MIIKEKDYSLIRDLSDLTAIKRVASDITPKLSDIIDSDKFNNIMVQINEWIHLHYAEINPKPKG